ncbi:EmrB/QacA subfamily drug resistance transporter [Microterricola gilva]|uniref:EmrB/QacA subfamily drug resistance transporter n=1 Tax=Microterricola gilva TaxID=393267 RepID=A0A4Q8AL41_9MICO|nr:DHA2 family efflux MFS transporter permease subunit [Microterricola gilva]RZU65224.1 EmrB/QacA subfamily drug resistance transporter [Microterricola gilva]
MTTISASSRTRADRRWTALVVLAIAQFLVVLDASIVNIALPSIGAALELDTAQLSWIITAYVLAFGGFLLLGGRLADRFGHRRVFLVGVAGFVAASALAGLSASGEILLASRALQGAFAALLAPASLALLTRLFTTPGDRAKALGVWGGVAGIGSAAGVLLGGVLTAAFGWEAIFFVNVPMGAIVLVTLPFLVDRDGMVERVRLDLPGAITVTGGLVALVGALSFSQELGFAHALVLGLFAVAAMLLAAFVVIERRSAQPLVDLTMFRMPNIAGGNLAMLFVGAATTATFFALAVYMQQVLGFSALESGLTQLPLAGTLVVVAGLVPTTIARFGARPTLVASLLILAIGLTWLSLAPADATFLGSLLLPTIVIGVGLGGSFVATTHLAVDGADGADAGLASGLVNTSQQIGGAIGLAVLSTVAASRTSAMLDSGASSADALTSGFSWVFLGAALAALAGAAAVVATSFRRQAGAEARSAS